MKRVTSIVLSLVMVCSILFNAYPVSASNLAVYGQYNYTSFTDEIFECVKNSVPVRSEPYNTGRIIKTIGKNAPYIVGRTLENSKGNTWIEIELEDGRKGFVYAGNCAVHRHNYYSLYNGANDTWIELCDCGYCHCVGNGESTFDLVKVVNQMVKGNFNDESLNFSETIASIMGNEAIDLFTKGICGAVLVPGARVPAAVGCALFATAKLGIAVRDITADVIYCVNDECDIMQTTLDVVSLVDTGISSVGNYGKVAKGFKLHVAANALSGIEQMRAIKQISAVINSKPFSKTDKVLNYAKSLSSASSTSCSTASCEINKQVALENLGGYCEVNGYPGALSGTYIIKYAYNPDLVVSASNGGADNGSNVYLDRFTGDYCQFFTVSDLGNGYYRLENLNGKVLDVYGTYNDYQNAKPNTNVHMWEVDDSSIRTQSWKIVSSDEGYILKPRVATSLALDVEGEAANATTGTNVHVYTANIGYRDTQLFYLVPVE